MAQKKERLFVKSHDTSVSVANSRGELEKMLRRYGATGFSVSENYAENIVTVSFAVPNTPGSKDQVPVQLPVHVRAIYDALYGRPMKRVWKDTNIGYVSVHNPAGYDAAKMEQASRVAWRNLILWVDAALSAAVAQLQTITEAFFAHTVVGTDTSGNVVTMARMIERVQGQLPPGVRALLTSTTEADVTR